MKKILYTLSFIAVILFSCTKDEDSPSAPTACFTVDATESTDSTHLFLFDQCPPVYDLSYWDFGDGQYSSNPNPSHAYNQYGSFNVKLTVTNSTGQTHSITKTITLGHYSLNKIVYMQTSLSTQMPKAVSLDFYSFIIRDTIVNQLQLPYTHQLSDSSLYDIPYYPYIFFYKEIDTIGDTSNFLCRAIYYPLVNNYEHIFATNTPGDTAKFSLYYKIVPR